MGRYEMKGDTWCPRRSARRGAPALEIQEGLAGALLGAAPQGGKFRTPFGARWQARRASPSPAPRPENSTFLPCFANSKPPLLQGFQPQTLRIIKSLNMQ